ncbi:MAG: hypothetical protein KBT27_00295 [Prevotellaceae bacterium]|nr:hypothetical protein [Candidatus Faecinaster equi]
MVKYSFNGESTGTLTCNVTTLGNKSVTPTEVERFLRELLEKLNDNREETKLKIEITPLFKRKLNKQLIDFIKGKEESYINAECDAQRLCQYDYYALTFLALKKLNFVNEQGKRISQAYFAETFNLRRASLNKHCNRNLLQSKKDVYVEIESNLLNFR